MNLFLLGFVSQLAILYGIILFSDYLGSEDSSKGSLWRQPARVRIKKR